MANMPEKVIQNIKEMKTVAFVTVGDDGRPNVVPVQNMIVKDPETILIGDNFFKKTAANLRQPDRKVAICSWVEREGEVAKGVLKREGYQVKGIANYSTEGPDYEAMKNAMSEKLPRKGCVTVKVTEVYDISPGANAGSQIA